MIWKTRPLAELCEIHIGRTPSRATTEYWGEDWPWLSIADMNQGRKLLHTKERISKLSAEGIMGAPAAPGTVALSFKLSIGKVGIIDIPMFTNEAIATLPVRDLSVILPEFLYWTLRTINLTKETDDAVMGKTLNKAKLARIEIPLPPLSDQQRIVDVLDRIDALRAKRHEAITLLGDLAQSIFLDMFGNPQFNPKGYRFSDLNSFVQPDDRINYGVVQPGDDFEDGVPLIRAGDLSEGKISHSSLKRISPDTERTYIRSRLKGNEILVGCVGSIGAVAISGPLEIGYNIARAVARIPIKDDVARRFIAEYLRSPFTQNYFTSQLRTVAQPTLNIKQLTQTPVFRPPEIMQQQFVARMNALDTAKNYQAENLAVLDELFASVQQRAFRGDLWDNLDI